ncbi:MAG: hypothetical protein VKK62_04625 [Synechococcaceae cyanobacterium]|nr:hypothetical protein [Synechococcaceae cyanobacterium]
MATPPAPLPPAAPALLVAAQPLPTQSFTNFAPPPSAYSEQLEGLVGQVASFDPVARAAVIASEMPRQWSGDYQAFDNPGTVLPVRLDIASTAAAGQMVVIRGKIVIGEVSTSVQGNLNAKSDQLDLLLTGDPIGGGIEPGAEFMGLQGLSLSGLRGPRLISMGGRLQLRPDRKAPTAVAPAPGPVIRGLW